MNLTFLLYLACPIGMAAMMWMMMRGNGHQQTQAPATRPAGDLTGLHQQLRSLESQSASVMSEIRRLRDEERSNDRDGVAEPSPLRTAPESES
jgi:hypothetical protein